MGKALTVGAASVAGLLIAGGIAFAIGQAPVFHWEMAGLIATAFAALAGTIAGASGAASGRGVIGLAVGASLGGLAFLGLSLSEQHPAALTVSGTLAVAASAGLAGIVGAGIGRRMVVPSGPARR